MTLPPRFCLRRVRNGGTHAREHVPGVDGRQEFEGGAKYWAGW